MDVRYSSEMNKLLTAAVVSTNFRRLLLRDAERALVIGNQGTGFDLSPAEREQILGDPGRFVG